MVGIVSIFRSQPTAQTKHTSYTLSTFNGRMLVLSRLVSTHRRPAKPGRSFWTARRRLRSGLTEPSGRKLRMGLSNISCAALSKARAAASSDSKVPRYCERPLLLMPACQRSPLLYTPR